MKRYLAILIFAILTFGCSDHTHPAGDVPPSNTSGDFALALCEGLMGGDNSSITKINVDSNAAIQNFYQKANPTLKLGDTANDIVRKGDTVYVTVTVANSIEAFDARSGKFIGRIRFDADPRPRRICFVDDSIAFVSMLYGHCLAKVNLKTFEILQENIPTGPSPEAIVYRGGKLFVANSGLGAILKDLPKAGTVSVFDALTLQETALLKPGPNVVELLLGARDRSIFAVYYNIPGYQDSIGGIVEYDAESLAELRRWEITAKSCALSASGDSLFFIADNQVYLLELARDGAEPRPLIKNPNKREMWYALSYRKKDGTLWVMNARNYFVDGEILVFDLSAPESGPRIFPAGLNPNTALFID